MKQSELIARLRNELFGGYLKRDERSAPVSKGELSDALRQLEAELEEEETEPQGAYAVWSGE